MENHSLKIYGKFFELTLFFVESIEGYELKSVIKERIIKSKALDIPSIPPKNTFQEKHLKNSLLKYLKDNNVGEYTYIEVNFDSIKIFTHNMEHIKNFNILAYIKDKKVSDFIRTTEFDNNHIVSTLSESPLIPKEPEEIILNNLILESILKEIDNKLSTLNISNNVILSGEMVWSNWLGDIGEINIFKNILRQGNYYINIDRNAFWKALLDKRKENDFIYKVSKKQFVPDYIYINSIDIQNSHKLLFEGTNKEIILSEDKFVNIISNIEYDNNFLKPLIINNKKIKSIMECSKREIALNLNESKSLVEMASINKISFVVKGKVVVDFGTNIESKILTKQNIKIGDSIGSFQKTHISVQLVRNKRYIPETLNKELVHKHDIIGYQKKMFAKIPIKAEATGKVIFDLLKYGYILIEDKYPKQELLSPWSGICVTHSNMAGYSLLLDFIKIQIKYQIGNNIVAFKENIQDLDYNKVIICKELSREHFSLKDIIDNNIKLIIVEQFNEDMFNNYIDKYPYILNYVSFAFISDHLENRDLRIRTLLNQNFIKSFILEDGVLKLYCDSESIEFKDFRAQYAIIPNNFVKRIRYERNNIYGIILKSQSSTEKVIKYDTEDVIEPNSNLINLKYKL